MYGWRFWHGLSLINLYSHASTWDLSCHFAPASRSSHLWPPQARHPERIEGHLAICTCTHSVLCHMTYATGPWLLNHSNKCRTGNLKHLKQQSCCSCCANQILNECQQCQDVFDTFPASSAPSRPSRCNPNSSSCWVAELVPLHLSLGRWGSNSAGGWAKGLAGWIPSPTSNSQDCWAKSLDPTADRSRCQRSTSEDCLAKWPLPADDWNGCQASNFGDSWAISPLWVSGWIGSQTTSFEGCRAKPPAECSCWRGHQRLSSGCCLAKLLASTAY